LTALLGGAFLSLACASAHDQDSPTGASSAGDAAAAASGMASGGFPAGGSSTGPGGDDGAGNGAGCAADGGAGAAPHFPADVAAAIRAKCQRCHAQPPKNGAPFPLLTWEDTHAPYGQRLVYQAMLPAIEKGIMPFTELKLDPPVEPLTGDEKALLLDWLGGGALPAEGAVCN
jgi:hypothetical protein